MIYNAHTALRRIVLFAFLVTATSLAAQTASQPPTAAPPSKDQILRSAIGFMPVQRGVMIDIPTQEELPQCKLDVLENNRGYVVYGPQGQVLRMFLDTSGAGKVDQWSYYRNGVEVYRDSDTNRNGKADQCRWFHGAGTRWGSDRNEDGIVDSWLQISPEELSAEVVLALSEQDASRFLRVALTAEELASLQLGEKLKAAVAEKIDGLKERFAEAIQATALSKDVEWYQFGGNRPGIVPAGRDECKQDTTVYENGIAVIRDGSENKQVALGSLVRIGENNWRTIDVPRLYDGSDYALFIPSGEAGTRETAGSEGSEIIKLVGELQDIQKAVQSAPAAERPAMHDLIVRHMLNLHRLASTPEDRESWMRQLTDAIMTAVQQDEYPDGVKNLGSLLNTIAKGDNRELTAFVKNRLIWTQYYAAINGGADQLEETVKWLKNREAFVEEFAKTDAATEELLQLAAYREMVDQPSDAIKWYRRVLETATGNEALKPIADRATGSIRRLEGIGKPIPFQTRDAAGNTIDVASLKGNPVLIYFWDSRTSQDLAAINRLAGGTGMKVIGINLDASPDVMRETIAKMKLDWQMIQEPDGLDSPVAVYWGVQTTPMMILYDKAGNIAAQNIPGPAELEKAIK